MTDAEDSQKKQEAWQRWNDELDLARKARGFDQWQTRAKKIIKRYRDERADVSDNSDKEGARFNILWANVQTLMPALFAKSPKPVVERRYLDRDEVGRTASVILERCLSYELDDGSYTAALKKVVLDRLLPGRGVAWIRYEPKFTPMPGKTQEAKDAPAPGAQEATTNAPVEQVAAESVIVDYIDWRDFDTSPARTWEEVWWLSKRVYMTRDELVARFGDKGKKVDLDWSPVGSNVSGATADPSNTKNSRAKVREIWNKRDRKVCWLAESYNEELLDERDDPLGLEGFWPVPKPLFATLTNDSLIPIPDYIEYQDQATELDDLTTRISNLTKAIKVAGVYDASVTELKRMFEEGFENELVPCDNMAEFSSKAGSNGMGHLWLLPIKDMAATLLTLYDARERVKQSLYEITGISDIVRGQATQGTKTATEQRIKGQFASMRLNDMQGEVARFARDTLRIMGELIAEHFDPMTLFEISGFEEYAKEQWPPQVASPPVAPMMGHNGGPPLEAPAAPPPAAVGSGAGQAASPPGPLTPMGMMAPPPDPEQVARQKAAEMFTKAVALLRNDKLRGFRIDIETDSIVEPDQQEMQQARTQLMQAISQFLPEAIQAGAQAPELKPLLARLLMFFLRGFKASRDIESAFEQFIDDQTRDAAKPKPPPPPSPEQIKVEGEMAKLKAEGERDDKRFQQEQLLAAEEAQRQREQAQFDMAIKQEEFSLEKQKMEMEFMHQSRMLDLKERDAALKAQLNERTALIKAEAEEHSADVKAESIEHSAEMKAKTEKKRANAPVGTA